jgi:outer membrane protein OmpA-like peptidoglycan-associated protein
MLFGPRALVAGLTCAGVLLAWPAWAVDCRPMIDDFNAAVEAGNEGDAQKQIDKIAVSAECGRYQVSAQIRLAAMRLSAAQLLIQRERPLSEYERQLVAAEGAEVVWQASATLGDVRFGQRRFAEAAQAFDRAIEIVKNETLTPSAPPKSDIEGIVARAAQARLLAANPTTAKGDATFVRTALDRRDGTLGGYYSRSVRGIVPRAVPVPITFDYAKTSFTTIGEDAARELAGVLREQRPTRIVLVGHTDVRGSDDINMALSLARAEAVAAFLRQNGVDVAIETVGKGAREPMPIADKTGLTQEDVFALDRRVEWRRD